MQEPSTYEKMKKYTKSIHFFKAGDYFDDEITDEYSECYQPLTYIGKSSFFNYSIESCYKTCLECNNILGDSTYHHCTNCNEKFYYNHNNRKKCLESCDNSNGYYLLENTKTCINEKPSINYYLDEESEIKVFKKCYNNCLSCSKGPNLIDNNMNCDSCDEINGFFFIENTKNCTNIKPYKYYLDQNLFKKCYFKCETCSEKGTEEKMNCDSCDNVKYKLDEISKNCIIHIQKCDYNFYYENENLICLEKNELCPIYIPMN